MDLDESAEEDVDEGGMIFTPELAMLKAKERGEEYTEVEEDEEMNDSGDEEEGEKKVYPD